MRISTCFISSLVLFGFILIISQSCTSDQLEDMPPLEFCDTLQVSYNVQVKDIIDSSCAFSGCHVAGSSAPGNYSSYGSMLPFLTDREFKRFVIDLRNDPELGMPPDWTTNPGPNDLTDEQFDIISCWVESGYPEN